MKFKIMDKEPIYLAGVVHYGELEKSHYSDSGKGKNIRFHLEGDEDIEIDVEDLKRNAAKLRDQIKDEVKFHTDHYNNDYKEHRKQWKEEVKGNAREARENVKQAKRVSEAPEMNNFEGAINRFGDVMESLGRHIEKNAHNWEANLKDWSVNFEKNMDGFGGKMDEFGDKMEEWGENFGKRMEEWGESFGEQWDKDFDESNKASTIKRYPIYRTYEEIYEKFIQAHPDHIKKQTFYEAQILDTTFENVTSMVMVGGRMSTLEQMRYPVATMTFEPEKWVAVKLTADEYAKDWLGSLEKVEQLKNYIIEPYFIVRHKKDASSDEIRLFCPISERTDER